MDAMDWTYDAVVALYKAMQGRAKRGFRVSAETAPLIIWALQHYAREHFLQPTAQFDVDVWDAAGSRIERRFARIADLEMARVAFDRAVAGNPHAEVTLRQGIRTISLAKPKPWLSPRAEASPPPPRG